VVPVLLSILSFLAGLWSASYLQVRQVRRRHLGIVRALRAELRRIAVEGAFASDEFSPRALSGSVYAVPHLSSWAIDLAVELASGDADHLGNLMDLERHLANLRLSAADALRTGSDVARLAAQLEHQQQNQPDDMHAHIESQRWLRKAEDQAKLSYFKANTDLGYAKHCAGEIMAALGDYEPRLERSLKLGLPGMPRSRRATA
jgi:hypothetical protein